MDLDSTVTPTVSTAVALNLTNMDLDSAPFFFAYTYISVKSNQYGFRRWSIYVTLGEFNSLNLTNMDLDVMQNERFARSCIPMVKSNQYGFRLNRASISSILLVVKSNQYGFRLT